jgi:hypothetical protein
MTWRDAETKYNRCAACRVDVEACHPRCPLCGAALTETPDENSLYPEVTEKTQIDRASLLDDMFVFSAFLFIGGSIVLNLIFWQGIPWFIAVAAPVLYTWGLVRITVLSDLYTGAKIFFQLISLTGMMLAFDFAGGWLGWSYEYVLPFLLITSLVCIDFYSWVHKSQWRDNLVYAILFVILGLAPLILLLSGVTAAAVPAVLCAAVSGLTVLGILKFTFNYIREELRKRFHI